MTDDAQARTEAPQEASVSVSEFLEAQRLAREMHERLDAIERNAKAKSENEQRRMVALSYAMASYGMGGQVINPPPTRPETVDIIRRAKDFDAFIRGEAQVVPIEVNTPSPFRVVPTDE